MGVAEKVHKEKATNQTKKGANLVENGYFLGKKEFSGEVKRAKLKGEGKEFCWG